MSIYIIIFIFLFVISFSELLDKKSIDRYNVIIISMIGFILALFAGTREMGFDYPQYVDMYKTVSLKSRSYTIYQIEIGFAFLISVFNSIGFSFHGFLFFLSLFLISVRLYFFKRLSPYQFLSILLYFNTLYLVTDMGQIRNAIALAIAMLAYINYIDGKKKQCWIKIILACLCHNSAFILVPAFILLKFIDKFSLKWVVIIYIILFPLIFLDIRVYFDYIVPFMPEFLGAKFGSYIYSVSWGQQLGFNMSFFLRTAILVLLFIYRKTGEEKIPYYNFILNMYVIGVFIFMGFNSVQEFAIRFGNYFKIMELIILPIFVYLTKDKIAKFFVYIVVCLYGVWSLYKLLSDPVLGLEYIPYKSIILF